MIIRFAAFLLLSAWLSTSVVAADFMFEANFGGHLLEGRPLHWNDNQMLLMARDGALHVVDPRESKDARRTASRFKSYEIAEMRAALQREFGDSRNITSSGHYLVVHRPGESDAWGQRFEQLYRSFNNYFRVRGIRLRQPPFPLVAIIYDSEREYYQAARQSGQNMGAGSLGHYDPRTNRVLMYDRVAQGDNDWAITANTIVHEATHQTAFNVGLHSRTAETPQWVVEGLATLFEARGVYHSEPSDTRHDRINLARLRDYRTYAKDSSPRELMELIASDASFSRSTLKAYANAWALTFYLSETRPRQYEQYLVTLAKRPPMSDYKAIDRVRDFRQSFGDDLAIFASNFASWMREL